MINSLVGILIFLTVALSSIGMGVVGFKLGQESAESRCEYKTQHVIEALDNCLMRERLGVK